MISKEEAIEKGLNSIDDDRLTIYNDITDAGDVYVAAVCSKEYLKTKDPRHHLIGIGPMIIDKENGYVLQYGSPNSEESAIKNYRILKLKWNFIKNDFPNFDIQTNYNIIIKEILDKNKLVDLILSFPFQYTIPEVEGDTIWRISKRYDKKILMDRLDIQPTSFTDIHAERILDFHENVTLNNLCKFDLEIYHKELKEWNITRATDSDLEPKW